MSFGGQSNTPWQRNVMQGHQTGAFNQGPQQMFMQQPPQQQPSNIGAFGHGSSGIPNSGNIFHGAGGGNAVSYPTTSRTAVNPLAFQQPGGGVGGNQPQHYNSIGTVTKLNNDCGLVNDEVFFYRNACKGPEPKLGDRVIFEASYAHTGQFKWNATRIQLMQPTQPQPLMGNIKPHGHTGFNASNRHNSPNRISPPMRGAGGNILDCHARNERERRDRDRMQRSRDKDDNEHARKRRREDLDNSRDRERAISRSNAANGAAANASSRADRERERNETSRRDKDNNDRDDRDRERGRDKDVQRTFSKNRRNRAIRRYMVQIPKYQLVYKTADVQELRQRYNNLYIPSDFFFANIKWSDSFTPENPFILKRPCKFHIMHKDVEPPFEQKRKYLEPVDADYLFSAKVMLLAMPTIMEIYEKCFENPDGNDDGSEHNPIHPSRIINFLVGVRGRNEPMAIGGPWSPSLDGENPDKNPAVLIRTAIRTCKALTGIDLSNCTQWYRFVELYYHRTEYKNKEKDGSSRVETVVIFLPDIHSCMPTLPEWNRLTKVYKLASENCISRLAAAASKKPSATAVVGLNPDANKETSATSNNETATLAAPAADTGDDPTTVTTGDSSTTLLASASNHHATDATDKGQLNAASSTSSAMTAADANQNVNSSPEVMEENVPTSQQPTHFSLLNLKNMKIQAIRDELLARNLSDKGVRNVLMARLAKALNQEKSAESASKTSLKTQQEIVEEAVAENQSQLSEQKQAEKSAETKALEAKTSESKSVWKIGKEKQKSQDKHQNNDESEDWADIIDFEMSDIVILDEYNANLVAEDTSPKELDEKKKLQLIRRYSLPTQPQIIVHPNKHAKGGKFDCAVMSLSVLLDYHPEDTKERFFEVSLFAELFNEMLMRDFGFNIYKEAYVYIDQSGNKADKPLDESTQPEKKDANKDDKTKDEPSNSTEPMKEDAKEDDTQSMKSESRKHASTINTPNDKDREKERESERETSVTKDKKMVLAKPELLLSFVYFDTTHCGYIFEKDLEDLIILLDLNLSRGQIKKILGKLSSRQAIYYRKLTDREDSAEQPYASLDDKEEDLPITELRKIAAGNWIYSNVYTTPKHNHIQSQNANENKDANNTVESTCKDDLIDYNGTVVHVGKLIEQIKRTENSYFELLKVNNELQKQHEDLQKEQSKSSSKIKNLQSDVKSLTRKLSDANQDLASINRKYRDQNACLSHIYNRVSPYFQRDKDKDSKSESSSSKDKDADKGKDKDKDKDKEKISKDKDKESDKDKSRNDKEKNTKGEASTCSASDKNDIKTKNSPAPNASAETALSDNANASLASTAEKDLASDSVNNEN